MDALLPHFALPGRPGTRSDVLRAIILRGQEELERDFEARMTLVQTALAQAPLPEREMRAQVDVQAARVRAARGSRGGGPCPRSTR
jgi:hypothetical protein